MRRVTGLVAAALGTFLIVLALLVRFFVVGQAVKFPLNENAISSLVATNASYFSPATLSELTGVKLHETITVQGDSAAGTSSRAVWTSFSYLYDDSNLQAVNYSKQRLAFDRRTGELINCCDAYIGTNNKVHMSGLGYVWPLGAQKQTYQIFDTTLLKPHPTVYTGSAVVDGLTTYKYVETVPATQIGTQTLPASLVGEKGSQTVTLPQYYQGTTTEYVDPITGAPVRAQSSQHVYLVNSSGAPALNLLDASFTSTPTSILSAVTSAQHYDSEIQLISVVIPVGLGVVGILLLVMGVVLFVAWRREEAEYGYEDEYETGEVTA